MIVVDNSVVVDLVVYPRTIMPPDPTQQWWAPTIIDAEFVNVLLRHHRSGSITGSDARLCLEAFAALAITRWQLDAPTRARMLDLGQRLSAYDAAYVAAAEALEAPLLTRDARLARTAADLVECRLV